MWIALTIISAEIFKNTQLASGKNAYVVITGDARRGAQAAATRATTFATQMTAGPNPRPVQGYFWNGSVTLEVPSRSALTLRVQHHGRGGNQLLGKVELPIALLRREGGFNGELQFSNKPYNGKIKVRAILLNNQPVAGVPVQPVRFVQPAPPVRFVQPVQPVRFVQPVQPVRFVPVQPVQPVLPVKRVHFAIPQPEVIQPSTSYYFGQSPQVPLPNELPAPQSPTYFAQPNYGPSQQQSSEWDSQQSYSEGYSSGSDSQNPQEYSYESGPNGYTERYTYSEEDTYEPAQI